MVRQTRRTSLGRCLYDRRNPGRRAPKARPAHSRGMPPQQPVRKRTKPVVSGENRTLKQAQLLDWIAAEPTLRRVRQTRRPSFNAGCTICAPRQKARPKARPAHSRGMLSYPPQQPTPKRTKRSPPVARAASERRRGSGRGWSPPGSASLGVATNSQNDLKNWSGFGTVLVLFW